MYESTSVKFVYYRGHLAPFVSDIIAHDLSLFCTSWIRYSRKHYQPRFLFIISSKMAGLEVDFSKPWTFADITLVVEGNKLYASKMILSMWSPVFEAMFRWVHLAIQIDVSQISFLFSLYTFKFLYSSRHDRECIMLSVFQ